MRLTHLGHACLLVEIADARILVDPGGWSAGFEDLRDLAAIVVTHQHGDHLDPERLPGVVRNNPNARLLVEREACEEVADLDPTPFTDALDETIAGVRVRGVGDRHAVINEFLPRVGNTGLVLSADGEPTFFHPGDAYDADPGPVDVLGLPLNAPWCASKETIAFARRIGPRQMVPIHDGLLNAAGRGLYLDHAKNFSLDETEVLDLAGKGATTVTGH